MMRLSEDVTKISIDLITQFMISLKIFNETKENLIRAIQEYELTYANFLAMKILVEREGTKNEQ